MKAVIATGARTADGVELADAVTPGQPGPGEILVRVRAAGLNRADLLQARGLYPPPPGFDPDRPGLEFAGDVAAIGDDVEDHKIGERVFGIAAGEAQAEYLLIRGDHTAAIPANMSYAEAAAVPEAFITANDAMITQAALEAGETVLIHAVGSGVGLAALQIALAVGATPIGTSRTSEKLEKCRSLGLRYALAVPERAEFADRVADITGGRGVDVILDLVGGSYLAENLAALARKGRMIFVGLTGGTRAEIDLAVVLAKRAELRGTVLRSRSDQEKAEAMARFRRDVVPHLAAGTMSAIVDRVYPAAEVSQAYSYLASNESFGKVVLEF